MFAKSVKSVLSAVIKRKFHPTASQYWKFLLEQIKNKFPINGGKDGFLLNTADFETLIDLT